MMSMVSFSKAATLAGATATAELYGPLKGIVTSLRNWAHYTNILLGGITMMVMYVILFRFTLVPKIIAGFGILATVLQLGTIAMPFLGGSVNFTLLAPIGLAQLALSLWLMVKGFRQEA